MNNTVRFTYALIIIMAATFGATSGYAGPDRVRADHRIVDSVIASLQQSI